MNDTWEPSSTHDFVPSDPWLTGLAGELRQSPTPALVASQSVLMDSADVHRPRQSPSDQSMVIKEALACAGRGWPIHELWPLSAGTCTCKLGPACTSPGKHPLRRGWPTKGTTDRQLIIEMLLEHESYGVQTGHRAGMVVLDVDPRHNGDETLYDLQRTHGRLPDTVSVITGGGGTHHIFSINGRRLRSSAGKLGPGLDVRADGGQIVGPGSLHASGQRYVWEMSSHPDDVQVAPLPESWYLLAAGKLTSTTTKRRSEKADHDLSPLFEILDGVPEGRRHISIMVLCCSLLARGAPRSVIRDLALHSARNCQPPLPPDEAIGIADDIVLRYQPGYPAGRRLPSENRIRIMSCIAAAAGPMPPHRVAFHMGLSRDTVKRLMHRMAREYGELVQVRDGYRLAGTFGRRTDPA